MDFTMGWAEKKEECVCVCVLGYRSWGAELK